MPVADAQPVRIVRLVLPATTVSTVLKTEVPAVFVRKNSGASQNHESQKKLVRQCSKCVAGALVAFGRAVGRKMEVKKVLIINSKQNHLTIMPEETFKPGDVVELKSGSPKMTVTDISGDLVYCLGYDHSTNTWIPKSLFKQVVLKKAEELEKR